MNFSSNSFKLFSAITLSAATALTACSSAPDEAAAASPQAATAERTASACDVLDTFSRHLEPLTFVAFDPSSFAMLSGITPPVGITTYAWFDTAGGARIWVLAKGNDVYSFYSGGKLVLIYDNVAGAPRWNTPDGAALVCSAAPTCLAQAPIDATQFAYNKARPAQLGACTAVEMGNLSAFYKAHAGDDDLLTTWPASVSAGCASCVFSQETDATWSPIVIGTDAAGDPSFNVDRGGCIETVSDSEACGRAYNQFQDCTLEACLEDCTTQQDFVACRKDASVLTTACKDAFENLKSACGEDKIAGYEAQCKGTTYTFEGPIHEACGRAP